MSYFQQFLKAEIEEISKTGDFDFHSTALSKILGSKADIRIAKTILDNEIRHFFKSKQDINSDINLQTITYV